MDTYNWEDIGRNGDYVGHELRTWQKEALTLWDNNGQRGVVEAITGTGKSLVGVAAIRQTLAEGGCALVLVPTTALLEQWFSALTKQLPKANVGRLTGGTHDDFSSKDVIVSTVQTACRQQPNPRSLALMVADEAHRYGSKQFANALNEKYSRRIALSGTYERQQDNGVEEILNPFFDKVIYEYGYGAALEAEVVAPFHLALVGTEFTKSEQAEYDEADEKCWKAKSYLTKNYFYPSEWSEFFAAVQQRIKTFPHDTEYFQCQKYMTGFAKRRELMAEASAKQELMVTLRDYLDDLSGTLVFAETKDSATRLAYIASQATSALPLTGDHKPKEREQALKDFGSGKVKVLCTPRILDEGIDVPEAELAVIIAASKSKRQMIQRMGRVIRKKSPPRPARILIAYVKGTSEDPATGAHEAFLDTVSPYALTTSPFDYSDAEAIGTWIMTEPKVST